ncbi:MAG TPA: RluA family pseudouridine synthase, partial [Myxococcota bacterium]|nr:RluA family pseudouridine synthase [Myxococcota bacterium]
KLREGQRVEVRIPAPTPSTLVPMAMPLVVLYEDAHVIALDKPAGLVVHPGAGTRGPTLVHGLLAQCGDLSGIGGVTRPGIVHRLDRGTSGVMVVAKHDRAHAGLAEQFSGRTVRKRYLAVVHGAPEPAQATLDTLYGRHPVHRQRFTARVTSGKRAVTTYRTVASAWGLAVLDVLLGTGRTHQIRVHLAEAGHPIVGDPLYGGRRPLPHAPKLVREAFDALEHQALHAARLELRHPITGAPLRFEAPPPPSWRPLARRIIEAS